MTDGPYSVAVLIGSLRRDSLNRKMARALEGLAPSSLRLTDVPIGGLPLYNQDLEPETPAPWVEFRDRIRAADAILFVSPEYNRSIPGALKNAIDVGSRPSGQSAFKGKPAAVITVSPGAIGGFGANHHIRQALVFLDMPTLQQPEAYVGGAAGHFDEHGNLAKEDTKVFLRKFLDAFESWIARLKR
ncbi:MAG TPA: NAD(P)H-dependent oxidoreductase [Candidatus Eisenbacteria bacterium]|jgi:chromate reductase, NAD(P)H dehydrogenase (quinone)|nr:NAD(P)H-dependent oxidoreductase [Candidatus Eisenbacteria bacterium]